MDDGMQQQTQCIDENMPLLALDQLARIEPVWIDALDPTYAFSPVSVAAHTLDLFDGEGLAVHREQWRILREVDRVDDPGD